MSSTSTSGSEYGDVVEGRSSHSPLSRSSRSPIQAGSCGKRPRSSMESFAQMTCPVCKEYFTPPIVQCYKGHSVCLSCVHRMAQVSKDERCPECRSHMRTTCRNYALEGQMQYITVGCVWEKLGCSARISLLDRAKHEAYCPSRPLGVKCYYSGEALGRECAWEGNPLLLPRHLREVHGVKPIKVAGNAVNCSFKLPKEDTFAASIQVIKTPISKYGKSTSKCILEFLYFNEQKIASVTLKSLEKEFSPRCKVLLCDRESDFNGPNSTFDAACVDSSLTLFRLSDVPIKQSLLLPYLSLQAYSSPQSSGPAFTLRIEFPNQISQNSD